MADPFLAALDQASRTVVARVRGELPVAAPAQQAPRSSGEIAHYTCCDPNWGLCGLNLSDAPSAGDGEQECVVCADLDRALMKCPLCPSERGAA
ncbi:hypothetical protein [Streptomyces sp. NPDC059003]|uniref:hypothetical protein n=1 Tax=Streptomyces sp. NPDC059003 TaxID=3346691 RepID=UPI003694149E